MESAQNFVSNHKLGTLIAGLVLLFALVWWWTTRKGPGGSSTATQGYYPGSNEEFFTFSVFNQYNGQGVTGGTGVPPTPGTGGGVGGGGGGTGAGTVVRSNIPPPTQAAIINAVTGRQPSNIPVSTQQNVANAVMGRIPAPQSNIPAPTRINIANAIRGTGLPIYQNFAPAQQAVRFPPSVFFTPANRAPAPVSYRGGSRS